MFGVQSQLQPYSDDLEPVKYGSKNAFLSLN